MSTKIKIKKQKEAALYVRKEPKTIHRWEKDGHPIMGEDGYYDPKELDKCLRLHCRGETKKAANAVVQVENIQAKVDKAREDFTKATESIAFALNDLMLELDLIQEKVNAALVQKLTKSF